MDADGIWRSFIDTGDPVCYLLAKRMERPPGGDGANRKKPRRDKEKTERTGDEPRPLD